MDDDSLGTVLVCINCGCFVVVAAGARISILRASPIVSLDGCAIRTAREQLRHGR